MDGQWFLCSVSVFILPVSSYETENYKEINCGSLVALADLYGVSVDYQLWQIENRKLPNVLLAELHLSDKMVELLKSGNINNRLLCEIATNNKFVRLMTDAEIYIDGHATARFHTLNKSLAQQRLAIIHDIRKAHEHNIDSTPDTSVTEEMTSEIQRALDSPGDYLSKMWKVMLSVFGMDYNKLSVGTGWISRKFFICHIWIVLNRPHRFHNVNPAISFCYSQFSS